MATVIRVRLIGGTSDGCHVRMLPGPTRMRLEKRDGTLGDETYQRPMACVPVDGVEHWPLVDDGTLAGVELIYDMPPPPENT